VSNGFYTPGEPRAAKVNDLFGAIARRYDLLNDLQSFGLHRRWKRHAAELAAVQSGDRALDLCCGTGDLALALARRGAEVTGMDFSPAMLEIAEARRQRNFKSQISNLKFMPGDALQIPFPDASFDIVTIGYGLRNLTSWEKGLDEMHRVAKPGARLVVLDFGKPANALWRGIYFAHLKCAVPLLGWIFCGNADRLRLYPRIAETVSGATGRRGKDARIEAGECTCHQPARRAMAINYGEKPV